MSDTKDEFNKALVNMQSELPAVPKTRWNAFNKFFFANHEDYIAVAKPVLQKWRFIILQPLEPGPNAEYPYQIDTVLMHENGERRTSSTPFKVVERKGMHYEQALGTAISYHQRYAYASMLGIATTDKDADSLPPPQETQDAPASDSQIEAIKQSVETLGVDEVNFCKYLQIDSLKALTASTYGAAIKALEAKQAALDKKNAKS